MAEQRAQRRLAAILAADVVAYSRLMRADETGTLAQLNAIRRDLLDPKIAEYGGRIVKTTGDGILIEFPSAVDAIQHAVDVQQAMAQHNDTLPDDRRMDIRMGINVGDVIVEGDDLFGDGVNVAARLEGLAEPGGICVSGSAYEQVRDKLQIVFEDLGEQTVKNIDRPVQAYRVSPHSGDPKGNTGTEDKAPLPLPDKPSIAVLPFDNMSGDPEQEYFADGIAEDLITALSRFRWFFVIARNSSFTYKGKAVDVKQVAAELGVQYVIEGSVRKAANRVRITAQLIEADSGRHVWAERYDRDLSDIFEVQDEITTAITGTVGPSFAAAEAQRVSRKAPENLDAWDLAMRATAHISRTNNADLGEAKRLFREAIAHDPEGSYAYSGLAMAYMREAGAGLAVDITGSRDEARAAANRALELDDQDAWAQLALAWVHHASQNNDLARTACVRALELNPNLAAAEGLLGLVCAHLGQADEAKSHIEKAVRLSPQDPSLPFWNLAYVIAELVADNPEGYLAKAKYLTERSPNFVIGWRHLAAGFANLGRFEEAKSAVASALALIPTDTLTSVRESVPVTDLSARDRYLIGLREAGYPE
jgi:adenylate cyclase